jgi:hypothetical protein
MENVFTVHGRTFHWSVITKTTEFVSLLRQDEFESGIDVLRITDDTSGFDVATRIDLHRYAGGSTRVYLGPLLIIGDAFPDASRPVQPEIMIRIRPRITFVRNIQVTGWNASRIVQWCLSTRFRAVRINVMNGIWRTYE